jgi:hypothetical protein
MIDTIKAWERIQKELDKWRPFQCGGELLLFSTVEVTPVLE